mmetsp:Transcript_30990/g.75580  ORF Transcript_30990/g.75580 Transcript_30990/m.75580 type:complete len:129 (+) Transcript_30990:1085-1471(+)
MADRALIQAGEKFVAGFAEPGEGFIVVVSGDKDTVPLIDHARSRGVGSLVVVSGDPSLKLLKAPDCWFNVDKDVLVANTKKGRAMKRALVDGVDGLLTVAICDRDPQPIDRIHHGPKQGEQEQGERAV